MTSQRTFQLSRLGHHAGFSRCCASRFARRAPPTAPPAAPRLALSGSLFRARKFYPVAHSEKTPSPTGKSQGRTL